MNRRIRHALAAVLLLASAAAHAVDTEAPLADPARQDLYERITQETRCLVCQNEAIADSTAPLAADLRREIRRMVAEGQDEEAIKRFLLKRYGDFVLYRPRLQANTLALWLAPVLLVLVALATILLSVRRRARMPADVDADDQPPPTGNP